MDKTPLRALLFRTLAAAMASLLLVYGCIKPKPNPPQTAVAAGILVGNEGTFQFNNASIGVWDETTNQYLGERFRQANQAQLGDILQHMWIDGDRLWLVVNNSQKIEIVDRRDFRRIATIRPIHSPRYVAPASDTTVWVSQIWEDSIVVVHRQRFEVLYKLPFPPGWSEDLLPIDQWMWISSPSLYTGPAQHHLYRMHIDPPHTLDSIAVGASPTRLLQSDDTTVWVLCTGHSNSRLLPSLYAVHAHTFEVMHEHSLPVHTGALGSGMCFDPNSGNLYILYGDVFVLSTLASSPQIKEWLPARGKSYYSIGWLTDMGILLLGDAVDFVQRGVVEMRKPPDTTLLNSFRAGIIPSLFIPIQ